MATNMAFELMAAKTQPCTVLDTALQTAVQSKRNRIISWGVEFWDDPAV